MLEENILDRLEINRMSLATDIAEAATEVGDSAQAAADRVTAAVGQLRTDLAAAIAEIERLIAAGSEDTEALEGALTSLRSADATVDSIEPASGEEPPAEA